MHVISINYSTLEDGEWIQAGIYIPRDEGWYQGVIEHTDNDFRFVEPIYWDGRCWIDISKQHIRGNKLVVYWQGFAKVKED